MTFTAAEIASHIGATIIGDERAVINRLAPAAAAGPGDLTFAENEKYLAAAMATQAAAILVSKESPSPEKTLLVVRDVRVAMARILPLFHKTSLRPPGVDPTASIHPEAQVDPTAYIGPGCSLAPGAKVGAHSVLMAGNHLGEAVKIGEQVTLHPNVVLYCGVRLGNRVTIHAGTVVGSDGYGYVFDEGRHRKILQVGNVVIEDDVEIGANAAIDRGALGDTVIGAGTKIDNLVHVAHNVIIGKHCLILGQVGFAGSTTLGDYSVVASQSGIAGHLKIGRQATVGAKSGVMRDIPDGGKVLGIPAYPDKQTKRQWVALQQLPDLIHQIRDLQKQLQALRGDRPAEGGQPAPGSGL